MDKMTGSDEQPTLSAKIINHREVLRILDQRLKAAEVQIRKLEREVYGGSQPADKQLSAIGTIY